MSLISPLNPAIHGIRVASVIAFSVSLLCVTFFLILLQYNIWPPSPNCDVCAPEFVAEVNLRRHDTFEANFNECHDDFSVRVKLRRHIRSGP